MQESFGFTVRDLLKRRFSQEEYDAIERLWRRHSEAEESRDIAGLLSTLTDDCVYVVANTGSRWEGKEGAARFYQGLLHSFADIHFAAFPFVIGPQGVWECGNVSGRFVNDWQTFPATGEPVELQVSIFFPWDPARRLFRGELVHVLSLPGSIALARSDARPTAA
jgi:hypothetical protein